MTYPKCLRPTWSLFSLHILQFKHNCFSWYISFVSLYCQLKFHNFMLDLKSLKVWKLFIGWLCVLYYKPVCNSKIFAGWGKKVPDRVCQAQEIWAQPIAWHQHRVLIQNYHVCQLESWDEGLSEQSCGSRHPRHRTRGSLLFWRVGRTETPFTCWLTGVQTPKLKVLCMHLWCLRADILSQLRVGCSACTAQT